MTDGWFISGEEAKRNLPPQLFCYPRDKVRLLSSSAYWGGKSEVGMVQRAVRLYGCVAIPSMTVQISALHPARAAPASPTSRSLSLAPIVRPPGFWSWSLKGQFLYRATVPKGPPYRHPDVLNLYLSLVILFNFLCVYILSCQLEREAWRTGLCVVFAFVFLFPLPRQHLTERQAGSSEGVKPCDCYVRWSLWDRFFFFFFNFFHTYNSVLLLGAAVYAYMLIYWVGQKVHLDFSISNLNKLFDQPNRMSGGSESAWDRQNLRAGIMGQSQTEYGPSPVRWVNMIRWPFKLTAALTTWFCGHFGT